MARNRYKATPVGTYTLRTGTPHELVEAKGLDLSRAKTKARAAVKPLQDWARRFNLTLDADCVRVMEEIDRIGTLRLGESRRWNLRDDHTGVTQVIEIERMG